MRRLGREHARRDRAGRRADDHLERAASARKDLRQRPQHAHLIGRARATARQHEPEAPGACRGDVESASGSRSLR